MTVGEIEKNPLLNTFSPVTLPKTENSASPPRLRKTSSLRMTSPTQQWPQLTAFGQFTSHLSLRATMGTLTVPSAAMTPS
jgi:hypothetical protein